MSVFDKVRSNSTTDERQTPGSQEVGAEAEHVCVFCGRDFDPTATRDCPTCGAELVYHGDR